MTKPSRVRGYIRVSSMEQSRGTSLDGQREEIERYCEAMQYPIPCIYTEVESAGAEKLDRRAELRSLLAEVRAGDLVVVAKQDRWSRDTLFFLSSTKDLADRGVRFLALAERFDPSTPEGRFAATVMAAVAEQERARIRSRTVDRKHELRQQGLLAEGRPRVGYRRPGKGRNGRLFVIDPAEAAAVKRIFELCAAGKSSREIRDEVRLEHPGVRGIGEHGSIVKILRSRLYLGEIHTERGWIRVHEPIVDRALFERAAAALTEKRKGGRRPSDSGLAAAYLLRGVANCDLCGARIGYMYGRDGKTCGYYACRRRLSGAGCTLRYHRVQALDEQADALAWSRLEELGEDLAAPPTSTRREPRVFDVAKVKEAVAARRARAVDLAVSGAITRDEFRAQAAKLDAELGRIEVAEAEHNARTRAASPEVRADALRNVENLRVAWRGLNVADRRRAISLMARAIWVGESHAPRFEWRTSGELAEEISSVP